MIPRRIFYMRKSQWYQNCIRNNFAYQRNNFHFKIWIRQKQSDTSESGTVTLVFRSGYGKTFGYFRIKNRHSGFQIWIRQKQSDTSESGTVTLIFRSGSGKNNRILQNPEPSHWFSRTPSIALQMFPSAYMAHNKFDQELIYFSPG